MFQFERDEDGMTVRVTGDSAEALTEIATALELNAHWPIFPLALDNLYRMCKLHIDTDEKLRDVVMLDSNEKEGTFLFDFEGLKIEAKKMEVQGLNGPQGENE
jgi:hypothetical protein